jgi:hypothetical protein
MDSVLDDVGLKESEEDEMEVGDGDEVMRSGEGEESGEKAEGATTYDSHKPGEELLSGQVGEVALSQPATTPYDSHKPDEELLSPTRPEEDDMDFAEFHSQPYDSHKAKRSKKLAIAETTPTEEQAAKPEDRWVEKEVEELFVVERKPPETAVKFTPCVVGTRKSQVDVVVTPAFDSMNDSVNTATRLPKGISDVRRESTVVFHPRQFHYVLVLGFSS